MEQSTAELIVALAAASRSSGVGVALHRVAGWPRDAGGELERDIGTAFEQIGWELETGLLAGLLGLLFIGPGRLSLDGAFGMETAVAPVGRSVTHRETEAA